MNIMRVIFDIRSCIEILANDIKINTTKITTTKNLKLLSSSHGTLRRLLLGAEFVNEIRVTGFVCMK